LLTLALPAGAQKPVVEPAQQTATAGGTPMVDPKLHSDVMKLMEASGARLRVQKGVKQVLGEGRTQMMQRCPTCAPAFGDEWEKLMLVRLKIDDLINVSVRVYGKYLTDDEIIQLIGIQNHTNESPARRLSPELQQKLSSLMPSIQSEIMGGCTQVGAKLGAEIGQEIEKEHPEYFKQIRSRKSSKKLLLRMAETRRVATCRFGSGL
jgi:hypothetical protein